MEDSIEFVQMEVKEEPMDHQGSSSHFPSSSGVDGVRDPDRDGYLIIDPSDDLKKEVKEEPFEDHSYATLPTSSSQQTSGTGDLRSHSGDVKEEDIWVKDEPIEEVDPIAVNTTTFTPKPESTWTEDSAQHESNPHTAEGSTAPLHVATAVLPQGPATDQDDSGSDTDEAAELEAIALQKKWENIRDCYRRECAKKKTEKSGSGATAVRKEYIFFSQLSFLSANNDIKPSQSNDDMEEEEDFEKGRCDARKDLPKPSAKKKRASAEDSLINALSTKINKQLDEPKDDADRNLCPFYPI